MSDIETPLHPSAYRQYRQSMTRRQYRQSMTRRQYGGGEYAYEPAICNCHSCRVGAGYHRPSG